MKALDGQLRVQQNDTAGDLLRLQIGCFIIYANATIY